MANSNPPRTRRLFFRFGAVMLTFTLLSLLLAAFAPQSAASTALRDTTPSATYGPSPTPEPRPYCGGFKWRGQYRDIDTDCDGIPDNDDNCDYTANPDQAKSNPDVAWGDACVPESGFRLNSRASEVIIYQMDNGSLHLYSPEGEMLGELSSAGLVRINPSLTVRQVAGRTYLIGYTTAAGQFRSTQFQSNALTFSSRDISSVAVSPATVEMKVGETRQFTAQGFHPTGIELWFTPRWSATGGTISRDGWYTAGSVPGDYVVTACQIGNLCGSAAVKVTQ